MQRSIARILDLTDPDRCCVEGATPDEIRTLLVGEQLETLAALRGSYALVARRDEQVYLARSLDRPLRYFLAKEPEGPMLIVAERIDEIGSALAAEGYGDQFHPSYTRMIPAHHITRLRLIGCPDPDPEYRRYFAPPMATLPADVEVIGREYVRALYDEIGRWLEVQDDREPIGVPFSGGIDSGAVLLCLYRRLLETGRSPARLKAFTLAVDGGGADSKRARRFLAGTELEMLGEEIEVAAASLDPLAAVELIEDYKERDVECATVLVAVLDGIRRRYPKWRLLVDGDGGDENLKDYPIEENPELTIRSVVNNPMLYQEGWGVGSIKHSLVYSGGYSRSCVRTYAPARRFGFSSFSPYTSAGLVATAEAIPFGELTAGSHERLYALKGKVVRSGVEQVLGIDMPVFEKCRFQEGVVGSDLFDRLFSPGEPVYRAHFERLHRPA